MSRELLGDWKVALMSLELLELLELYHRNALARWQSQHRTVYGAMGEVQLHVTYKLSMSLPGKLICQIIYYPLASL